MTPTPKLKTRINGVPIDTLVHAYELISIGGTISGVAERFGINYDRMRIALWQARTHGIRYA